MVSASLLTHPVYTDICRTEQFRTKMSFESFLSLNHHPISGACSLQGSSLCVKQPTLLRHVTKKGTLYFSERSKLRIWNLCGKILVVLFYLNVHSGTGTEDLLDTASFPRGHAGQAARVNLNQRETSLRVEGAACAESSKLSTYHGVTLASCVRSSLSSQTIVQWLLLCWSARAS